MAARKWTEEEIERQVLRLAADTGLFPSSRQFEQAGLQGLESTIRTRYGKQRLAAQLNLTLRGRGRPTVWDDDKIAATIHELAVDGMMPSTRQMQRSEFPGLVDAVQRRGGVRVWAEKLNLQCPDGRRGPDRLWTDGRIEEKLREFVGDRPDMPMVREFLAAGDEGRQLLGAIYRRGGTTAWAARIDVRPRGRGRPARVAA